MTRKRGKAARPVPFPVDCVPVLVRVGSAASRTAAGCLFGTPFTSPRPLAPQGDRERERERERVREEREREREREIERLPGEMGCGRVDP